MEITGYVSTLGRRLWLIPAIPALATLVAFGYLFIQPQEYRAEVTLISPPSGDALGNATINVAQNISNLQGAITSQPVVERVSADTGVPPKDINGVLLGEQVGNSNIMEVSYTGTNREQAENIVTSATDAVLDLRKALGSPRLRLIPEPQAVAEVSQTERLVRGLASVAGIGLVLSLGLLFLLEAISPSAKHSHSSVPLSSTHLIEQTNEGSGHGQTGEEPQRWRRPTTTERQ